MVHTRRNFLRGAVSALVVAAVLPPIASAERIVDATIQVYEWKYALQYKVIFASEEDARKFDEQRAKASGK
jgi:hypothetical protein